MWKKIQKPVGRFFSKSRFVMIFFSLFVFSLPYAVFAQSINLDFGNEVTLTERSVQVIILITLLSLVPALAIMFTCFPFMITVLAILRQGIGLQQSPPNMLIVSLALFLTYFVMEPVFEVAWRDGISPIIEGQLAYEAGVERVLLPFRGFMQSRVNTDTLQTFISLRDIEIFPGEERIRLSVLVPSFILSEIERAFQIGFLLFLPFLIIDLVVAAILMSMGMMMVPPVIVSLPFKLAFFVVADGWTLISVALVRSYS